MKSSVLAQIEWSSILAAFSAQFRTCNFGENFMTGDSLVLELVTLSQGLTFRKRPWCQLAPSFQI